MMPRLLAFVATALIWLLSAPASAQVGEPPWADAFDNPTNFLACQGNGYALCYYSGPPEGQPVRPGTSAPALPCHLDGDLHADCTCYAFDDGTYDGEPSWNYVEIGSILNAEVREENRLRCGDEGQRCLNMVNMHDACLTPDGGIAESEECQQAPVCALLGNPTQGIPQTLYPDEEDVTLISTFSFAYTDVHYFGSTDCTDEPDHRYAGCMTAPCRVGEDGLVTCECPIAERPFQVGQTFPPGSEVQCRIRGEHIWSAAYHEPSSDSED